MAVPWTKILSHKGVYAIIIAHFGTTWGQLVLYSEVPAYLDKIMGVNIKAVNFNFPFTYIVVSNLPNSNNFTVFHVFYRMVC